MVHDIKIVFESLFGHAKGRNILNTSRVIKQDVRGRIADFEKRFSTGIAKNLDEKPIFILSAGWRSGSTLLQRMIMANNQRMLIWGEPFDRSNIFDRMLDQFRCITQDWPTDESFKPVGIDIDLSEQWVANLYPEAHLLKKAHLAFFNTLFSQPAKKAGYENWGIKEVRLTTEHACYLKWLYPNAKFIMLYRNPLDAYRSYRRWRYWFRSWPDKPILTPYAFGRNWANIASDFINSGSTADGIVVRYEDLNNTSTINQISDYIGWKAERPSSLKRLGSSRETNKTIWIPKVEKYLLKIAVAKAAHHAGYTNCSLYPFR